MPWRAADVRDFKRATASWRATWAAYDEPLRAVCATYAGHGQLDGVVAKVGLVQRAYEAGLERHVLRRSENSILVVARALHRARRRIDPQLDHLHRVAGDGKRFDAGRLAAILKVHASIVDVIRAHTRGRNAPRSFVSKYLHFHCAGVPMYDDRARKIISRKDWYGWQLTSRRDDVRAVGIPATADRHYARYLQQFLAMWNDAVDARVAPTVRSLDAYLIFWAEWYRARGGK